MASDLAEQRRRLANELRDRGVLTTQRAYDAFLQVPREEFLPPHLASKAYRDRPLPIGAGQTISAPHMVAIMLDALDVHDGDNVLEVGTGSGYHAALLARLAGPAGHVTTIEYFADLAGRARERLTRAGVGNADVVAADGTMGWPERAPYDRISVACAAPKVPAPLLDQLGDGGIMVIPVGSDPSRLLRLVRRGNEVTTEDLGACAFVPMLSDPRNGQG